MEYNTRKTLEIYLKHAGKYKFWGSIVLFAAMLGAATNVIVPLYYKKFFDILVNSQSGEDAKSGLISVLVSIAMIQLAGWVSWRTTTFVSAYFQTNVIADLSNTCFKYLHKHSFSYFNNNFTGSLVKRVSYFPRAFEQIADRITWNFVPLIVSIVIITTVLFLKNILLGAVIVIWLLLVVVLNWFLAKYKLKFDIQASEAKTEATGFLSDAITNNSNVKLFCGYKSEVNGFAVLNDKIRRLSQFSWNLNSAFEAV